MLEVVIFAVGGFEVEGLFGDEGGNVLILLFLGGFGGFSRHSRRQGGEDAEWIQRSRWSKC